MRQHFLALTSGCQEQPSQQLHWQAGPTAPRSLAQPSPASHGNAVTLLADQCLASLAALEQRAGSQAVSQAAQAEPAPAAGQTAKKAASVPAGVPHAHPQQLQPPVPMSSAGATASPALPASATPVGAAATQGSAQQGTLAKQPVTSALQESTAVVPAAGAAQTQLQPQQTPFQLPGSAASSLPATGGEQGKLAHASAGQPVNSAPASSLAEASIDASSPVTKDRSADSRLAAAATCLPVPDPVPAPQPMTASLAAISAAVQAAVNQQAAQVSPEMQGSKQQLAAAAKLTAAPSSRPSAASAVLDKAFRARVTSLALPSALLAPLELPARVGSTPAVLGADPQSAADEVSTLHLC